MKRFGITVGTVGVVGVLATGLAATAQAQDNQPRQTECTAHELPVPAGTGPDESIYFVDADPSGRYVLGSSGSDGLLWVDGEFETKLAGMPLPSEDAYNEFYGVNGSGTVIGVMVPGNDGQAPWKYEDGEYTYLRGGANWVEDINGNGDIVGTISNERTILWPNGDPEAGQELPGMVTATDISEKGVVIGSVYDQNAERYLSYYWPDLNRAPQRLDNPAGVRSSTVNEIAGDWVAGYDETTDDSDAGLLWNLADGTVEKLPYPVSAVNSAGDIGTEGKIHRADGSTLELEAPGGTNAKPWADKLMEPGSDVTAVGDYEDKKDIYRPVAWTC